MSKTFLADFRWKHQQSANFSRVLCDDMEETICTYKTQIIHLFGSVVYSVHLLEVPTNSKIELNYSRMKSYKYKHKGAKNTTIQYKFKCKKWAALFVSKYYKKGILLCNLLADLFILMTIIYVQRITYLALLDSTLAIFRIFHNFSSIFFYEIVVKLLLKIAWI